jgi:pectinesterase
MRRRTFLAASAASAIAGVARAAEPAFNAAVGAAAPGAASFATVSAAIAAAPAQGRGPWRILVGPGLWRERLVVDKPWIHLVGTDRKASIVSFDLAAGMPGADGKPVGTWGCATVIVRAPDFSARNLTLQNGFDYVADLAHPVFERVGSNGAQAVAVMLDNGADRSRFEDVDITGHQDTLFADQGRGLFRACRIGGSVDFIFGGGRMLFDRCEIVSRYRPLMQRNHGFIAVPSTPRPQPFGLVFDRCRLTREALVPPASVVLGRPWRPGRQFADGRYGDPDALGMAAFLNCWMDDHISADGWDEMGYADKTGTRVFLEPGEARLAEFGSTGPGAFVTRRRPQLTAAQARGMTATRVLDGWSA